MDGQTHSISGLKWIPDPGCFLPSTIRKRDNMFCLRFAPRKSELFVSLGFLLIIIVPAFISCHARAPGYTYTRMKTVSCVQTVVQFSPV